MMGYQEDFSDTAGRETEMEEALGAGTGKIKAEQVRGGGRLWTDVGQANKELELPVPQTSHCRFTPERSFYESGELSKRSTSSRTPWPFWTGS